MGRNGNRMKYIKNFIFISIVMLLIIHVGPDYTYSQQDRFLIELKSGVEIFSPTLLIKDGFVFYRFTSYGHKNVGISIKFVKQILEIKKDGGRQPIDILNPPKSLTKEKMISK